MRFRRIVLAGDILRPGGDDAGDWLLRLLGGLLTAASGLPVDRIAPGEGFDPARAYALFGAEHSWRGWAAITGLPAVPSGVLDLYEEALEGAIVVGFGMAEISKRVLSHLDIPYLDLAIHPVRFLDDLFFAIRTNDADVFAAMLPHHAEEAHFRAAAGLIAASRGGTRVEIPSPILLVGQRGDDPALLRDGALTDFSRFPDAVRRAAGPGGIVAFRPHPAEPGDLGLFAAGVPYASLHIVDEDPRALLASGAVRKVVGLSSPVLTEARCFGLETEALLGDPLDLANRASDAEPGQALGIVDGPFQVDFWREVLAPLVPVTTADGGRWRRPPGSLRAAYRRLRPDDAGASDALGRDPAQAEAQVAPLPAAGIAENRA